MTPVRKTVIAYSFCLPREDDGEEDERTTATYFDANFGKNARRAHSGWYVQSIPEMKSDPSA